MSYDQPDTPVRETIIPLSVPEIRGNEWKYIKECLDTGWVSSVGSFVERFEVEVAATVGARYAVATASGTAALHIALLVAGVEEDDEVLVPALTFIAPANAVRYVGAWPRFVDVDPDYWQMDPEKVVTFLDQECRWANGELRNKTTGRRIKAIVPVHILGHPVDMDPIRDAARKYNLVTIEDGTESLGAKYKDRMVGHLGDIACFSFNGNKIITSGGGGMIVTENASWAERARYLTTQARDSAVEYIHNSIGFNYRLTNIQAAMGVAQLERLDEYLERKQRHARAYAQALCEVPGVAVPREAAWAVHTFWLYTILVDPYEYGCSSRELIALLKSRHIESRPLWMPIPMTPAHRQSDGTPMDVSRRLYERAVSLPSSVGLTAEERGEVIGVIREGPSA